MLVEEEEELSSIRKRPAQLPTSILQSFQLVPDFVGFRTLQLFSGHLESQIACTGIKCILYYKDTWVEIILAFRLASLTYHMCTIKGLNPFPLFRNQPDHLLNLILYAT